MPRDATESYVGGGRKDQTPWPSKGHPTQQLLPWEAHSPETML